jgi:hypothetical protein
MREESLRVRGEKERGRDSGGSEKPDVGELLAGEDGEAGGDGVGREDDDHQVDSEEDLRRPDHHAPRHPDAHLIYI